jgi:hypothetical protein
MRIRANSADCKSALRHAATSRKAAALALTMASFSGSRPRYIGNPKPPRHGSAWETLFSANPVLTSGVRAVNHAAVLPIVRRLCLGWRCRGLAVTKRGPLPARSGTADIIIGDAVLATPICCPYSLNPAPQRRRRFSLCGRSRTMVVTGLGRQGAQGRTEVGRMPGSRVSVVMAVYDGQTYLTQAIDSVFGSAARRVCCRLRWLD